MYSGEYEKWMKDSLIGTSKSRVAPAWKTWSATSLSGVKKILSRCCQLIWIVGLKRKGPTMIDSFELDAVGPAFWGRQLSLRLCANTQGVHATQRDQPRYGPPHSHWWFESSAGSAANFVNMSVLSKGRVVFENEIELNHCSI